MAIDLSRPKNVVAVRDEIVSWWGQRGATTATSWDWRWLADAEMVWVSPALMELVVDAANTVPDDLPYDPVGPFESALVVFPGGLRSTDGVSGQEISVDGILWGPIRLQDNEGIHLCISSYSFHVPLLEGTWVNLGRSEWLNHQILGDVDRNLAMAPLSALLQNPPALAASMTEDRRLIVALWQIMAMDRVVERRTWTPMNKSARRRSKGRPTKVQVLDLHTSQRAPTDSDGEHGGFSVRWWVRPHWRWQAYGPRRGLRRLTLISGHIKGPEDAPLLKRDRVWRVGHRNQSPPKPSP